MLMYMMIADTQRLKIDKMPPTPKPKPKTTPKKYSKSKSVSESTGTMSADSRIKTRWHLAKEQHRIYYRYAM